MKYKIIFTLKARKDYISLDGSLKKKVNSKIAQLEHNPLIGQPLGNKHGIDLSGLHKLYFEEKSYRIVYRLITPAMIEVIEIFGIGKRDKGEIYKIISKRLIDLNKSVY